MVRKSIIAKQDSLYSEEIAAFERMDAGRQRLHQRGVGDTGPYQSPLEDGMRRFHAWYRRALSSPAASALRVVAS
jgi:hypothetical protein